MKRSGPKRANPLKLKVSYSAAFAPNDSVLAIIGRDVVVWNVDAREKRYRIHPVSHPSCCAFDSQGTRLAIKTTSGKIITLRPDDGGDLVTLYDHHSDEGSNLFYSCCSQYLFYSCCSQYVVDGSWNGGLFVRDAATGKVEFHRQRDGEMVTEISRDGSGSRWAVLHSIKGTSPPAVTGYISLWDWPFRSPRLFEYSVPMLHQIALSPDGSLLAVHSDLYQTAQVLTVHSTADFTQTSSRRFDDRRYPRTIAWSPDGREIAVVYSKSFTFCRYPELSATGELETEFGSDIAYSSDGRLVALCDWKCGLLLERSAIPAPSLAGENSASEA